jgi:hypothetical protein
LSCLAAEPGAAGGIADVVVVGVVVVAVVVRVVVGTVGVGRLQW